MNFPFEIFLNILKVEVGPHVHGVAVHLLGDANVCPLGNVLGHKGRMCLAVLHPVVESEEDLLARLGIGQLLAFLLGGVLKRLLPLYTSHLFVFV